MTRRGGPKEYLLASDFDQTLSFNDSGDRARRAARTPTASRRRSTGLARIHLVQQGGELAYLLLHDPEYRQVRREHLVEVGRRIRLKSNIGRLVEVLERASTAIASRSTWSRPLPRRWSQSALAGIVPAGADPRARASTTTPTPARSAGSSAAHAGYGKVATFWRAPGAAPGERRPGGLRRRRQLRRARDAARQPAATATRSPSRRTRTSRRSRGGSSCRDDALSVLVPVLEDIVGWDDPRRGARALRAARPADPGVGQGARPTS